MIRVTDAMPSDFGWLAKKAQLAVGGDFRAIKAVDGDRIVGMVGYDGWTPNSVCMHVAIDEPIAVRRLMRPAFEKPFMAFGRGVAFASILSTNEGSIRLVRHVGFSEVGRLRDAYLPGVDLVVFELRREEWMRRRGGTWAMA